MTLFVITKKSAQIFKLGDWKSDADYCEVLSYGLSYMHGNTLIEIDDITSDKKIIKRIAETFNREQPEHVHIEEILENFLLDFTDF